MTSKDKTKSLVNKATTDDRNPPSGYLLKELAARTMQINECQTIEDLIVKKLAKNKPYIKYKALRVVKFLCETGSHNWRRAWQRNTDKLRDAQQFRGPPDPIYGDAPYQQVRKAAKDAMQAVFAQNVVDNTSIRSKIKGIGGDNAYSSNDTGSSFKPPTTFGSGSKGTFGGSSLSKNKAPSAPGGGWGKRMEGHGNTNYTPSVSAKTYQPHTTKAYMNPANLSGSPSHSTHKLDTRGLGKKRKKKKVGGIWGADNDDASDDEEEDYAQYEPEESFGSNSNSYSVPKTKRSAFGGQIKKGTTSSGQYEKRWVDDIVKSGGVGCKIVELPKFVSQFENLSKSHVLGYLDEKLEDSSWQKQGKALALIEALLKGKSGDDVVEYFTQSPDNVQSLINAKKSILRRKANAVMEYLDVDDEDEPSDDDQDDTTSPVEPQQPQRQSVGNLLGDDMDTPQDTEEHDMFVGLQTHEEPTSGTTDLIGNDMFGDMDKKHGVHSGNGGGDDLMNLMGDMEMNTNVNTNTNANTSSGGANGNAPAQESAKKPYQDIFADITGGGGTQPPPNTATHAETKGDGDLSSFFGGGSGGNVSNGNASGGTQSAFGFDIGGSSNNAVNTAPVQQQPAAAAMTSNSATSAFGFNLGTSDNTASGGMAAMNTMNAMNAVQQSPAQQQNRSMNASASSLNSSSAFGFDLSDGQQAQSHTQPQSQQQPMMTTSMMATNQQAQMNMMSQMNQMQQMQSMMAQMQNMNMNPNVMAQMNQMRMNQGNMMSANMNNMNMMQQPQAQQSQLFAQALQGVNGQAQQQAPKSSYRSSNDPFSGLTGGSQAAQATQAPTQPPQPKGPDPFAQFGLNSMQ